MSTCGSTTSGTGSGSEADLPESEFGPLESDYEDRLSATGLVCSKNQARKTPEAKIRERLLAALPRRATVGKRYTTADRGRSASGICGSSGSRDESRSGTGSRSSRNGSESNSGSSSGGSSGTGSGSNSGSSSGSSSGSTVAHEGDSMQHARSSRPQHKQQRARQWILI